MYLLGTYSFSKIALAQNDRLIDRLPDDNLATRQGERDLVEELMRDCGATGCVGGFSVRQTLQRGFSHRFREYQVEVAGIRIL